MPHSSALVRAVSPSPSPSQVDTSPGVASAPSLSSQPPAFLLSSFSPSPASSGPPFPSSASPAPLYSPPQRPYSEAPCSSSHRTMLQIVVKSAQ